MEKIDFILKEVLNDIKPSEKDLEKINFYIKRFIPRLKKQIEKQKVDAQVFIGGSFAKKTLIKKQVYDIDIFLRFDKRHSKDNISRITQNILKYFKNVEVIHGSRDYFQIKIDKDLVFEIIPVIKIRKPEEAENVTDLSYFHVSFIKKNLNSKKILEEVMLAKAFCYANNVYGAESYINGFSGYSIELLIYYYKTFKNFLKQLSKIKERKVIDPGNLYANKKLIFMDMNSAKLQSPIILIDPTYKHRNALAALSSDTFEQFKKTAKNFLKQPSVDYFKRKKLDLEKIKADAKRKKLDFVAMRAKTSKQKGVVAGSKLFKFFKYLKHEAEKFFDIKQDGFEYTNSQCADYFFVARPKKEIILKGPEIIDKKNAEKFRKKHRDIFVKKNRLYAREKPLPSLGLFIENFKKKHKKQMRDMYIDELKNLYC